MSARHPYQARTATTVLATLLLAVACHEADQPTEPSARVGGQGGPGGPAVNSVVPDISLPGVTLDLTVNGSGFDQGSSVRLERGGVPASGITTNSTKFITPKKV